jgi:cytidine deaminase
MSGATPASACREILNELTKRDKDAGRVQMCHETFMQIYYKYLKHKLLDYLRQEFARSILDGDIEEAIAHEKRARFHNQTLI